MKSRRISRPTRRTATGRVVYTRPKHYWSDNDTRRILKKRLLSTDGNIFRNVAELYILLLDVLRVEIEVLRPKGVLGQTALFVELAITLLQEYAKLLEGLGLAMITIIWKAIGNALGALGINVIMEGADGKSED